MPRPFKPWRWGWGCVHNNNDDPNNNNDNIINKENSKIKNYTFVLGQIAFLILLAGGKQGEDRLPAICLGFTSKVFSKEVP